MSLVKRASVPCIVEGRMQPGAGWSAAGMALQHGYELPSPVREVLLHVDLEKDGGGYLLIVTSDDPSIWCDDWFASQDEAEKAAADWYGVHLETGGSLERRRR